MVDIVFQIPRILCTISYIVPKYVHIGQPDTKNIVHQLSVSLEDMYNGTIRKLALQKNVICDTCDGEYVYCII